MLLSAFLALTLAAGISWLLLNALIPVLRRRLLDKPNVRSSHLQPTPRGGGIAILGVSLISSSLAVLTGRGLPGTLLPLLAAPLAVVGLLDDRYSLPSSWRYAAQLLTAVLILVLSPLATESLPSVVVGNWLLFLVLFLLVVSFTAVINFINFMDGLDGLVAGCMAVSIAALAIALDASWSLWALVGSLFGFLIWNWSPAKVFMGDVGSTFLGAVFAGLAFQASSWPKAICYLLVATPLLGDAFVCVFRRLFARQPVFQAHRLHLFQRLHQAGWSHSRVSYIYIAATAAMALAMLFGGLPWVLGLAVVEMLLGVWLDQRVAAPFSVASRS